MALSGGHGPSHGFKTRLETEHRNETGAAADLRCLEVEVR